MLLWPSADDNRHYWPSPTRGEELYEWGKFWEEVGAAGGGEPGSVRGPLS